VGRIVQSAFNGRRIVIFSGGVFETDERLLGEIQAIQAGRRRLRLDHRPERLPAAQARGG
jgi:hypothetical protein